MRSHVLPLSFFLSPMLAVYEGEGGDGGAATGDGSGDAAAAAAAAAAATAAAAAAAASGSGDDDKPTLSQKQVNAIIAKEKAQYQKQIQQQVKDLETLKKSKSLTEGEKEKLATRIEELNNSLLSKEEMARKEKESLSKKHQAELEGEKKEKETWRSRYTRAEINRAISDEAKKADGFDEDQFVRLLSSDTRLVEAMDESGQPTGEFSPMVKFNDTDKDGKPIKLDVSVADALKRMKEMPKFANLFKAGVAGGLGGNREGAGGGGSGDKDPSKMNTAEYREWRKKNGLGPQVRRAK